MTSGNSTSSHTPETQNDKLTQDRVESGDSRTSALLVSPRGLQVLTRWVQLWANKRLDPAFTEPWLQAKVIGRDKGGGKARPIAFEEMLLKMVTSSILRAHISQVRRAAGAYQFGIYHEGGAPKQRGRFTRKWPPNQRKCSLLVTSRMGSEQRGEETQSTEPGDGARSWAQSLPICGQVNKECNQQHGRTLRSPADQLRSEMGFCRVRARHRWRLRWLLRVAMKEFDEEMRKQGVGWTTELEYCAYVDDITIATRHHLL